MDKKGYYAIIPANVRYDESLTPNAKLLYGEITALCNEKGYCWATNGYFAELYNVSKVSISKWIGSLKDAGYVSIEMEQDRGTKQILNRYIRLLNGGIKEKLNTPQRKVKDPIKEKFKDNNTVNTTSNITVNNIDHFESFWSVYPRKVGKAQARKAWDKLKLNDDTVKMIAENIALRIKYGEWSDANKTFIPHAATYLNNARWEDEVEQKVVTQIKQPAQIKKRDIEVALTDRSWAN
jgi:DNA-binding transcriptional ArsR family regulator